jgi:hypothetical protein
VINRIVMVGSYPSHNVACVMAHLVLSERPQMDNGFMLSVLR